MATWEECNTPVEKIIPPKTVKFYTTVNGTVKKDEPGNVEIKLPYSGSGYPLAVIINVKNGYGGDVDDLRIRSYIGYAVWKVDPDVVPDYTGTDNDKYMVWFGAKNTNNNVLPLSARPAITTQEPLSDDVNTARKISFTDASTMNMWFVGNTGSTYGFMSGKEYEYVVIYKED